MEDIYQRIWNADQNENGIQSILDTQSGDLEKGYVKVNSNINQTGQDLRVLTDLHIPEHKKHTYKLGVKLFDNFSLSEHAEEIDTAAERTEVHDFVDAIIDTAGFIHKQTIDGHECRTFSRGLGTSLSI